MEGLATSEAARFTAGRFLLHRASLTVRYFGAARGDGLRR
jgi:hypothetical protein